MDDAQITLEDLIEIRNIIDLASRRGAFHASEMSRVGQVFDKVSSFVDVVSTHNTTAPQPLKGENNELS